MYYLHIKDGQIISKGQVKMLGDIVNIEVPQDVYNNSEQYIYQDGEIVLNPNYEEEQAAKEAERIAKLKLRRGDVFRGLVQAKGVTKAQIGAMIENMPETTQEEILVKELARIDFEDAIEFFRGNPLVDTIGLALSITPEQLDKFFEYNDYMYLISEPDVNNSDEPTEENTDVESVIGNEDVNNSNGASVFWKTEGYIN